MKMNFKIFRLKKEESNHQLKFYYLHLKNLLFCAKFNHFICLFPCSLLEKCFNNFICCPILFRGSPWCNVLANSFFTFKWPGDNSQKIIYPRTRNDSFHKSIMFCNYLYWVQPKKERCASCSNNTLNNTAHGVYSNSWWNLTKACR